jgi:nucleoside-diphosphate-sugar epimerase
MKVVITGGAGFIGKQLAERLSKLGELPDAGGKPAKIDEIVLFDAVEGPPPAPGRVPYRSVTGDVADRTLMRRIIAGDAGAVPLAAVVSRSGSSFDLHAVI